MLSFPPNSLNTADLKDAIRPFLSLSHDLFVPVRVLLVVVRHELSRAAVMPRVGDMLNDCGQFLVGRGGDDRLGALSNSELLKGRCQPDVNWGKTVKTRSGPERRNRRQRRSPAARLNSFNVNASHARS